MYFYDTNILLSNLEFVKQNGEFWVSRVTIAELENIKTSGTKSDGVKFQARRAVRWLVENQDKWHPRNIDESSKRLWIETYEMPNTNDSEIILTCYELRKWADKDVVFVTNDLLCLLLAKRVGMDCKMLNDAVDEKVYSGYKEVELSSDDFTYLYEDYQNGINKYGLIENQYLIIHCDGKTTEYVYRNGELKTLKLPKAVKALNAKQRCALDLLENEDIPIKVICGVYGTGKTYLSINVAVNKVTKSTKSNISSIFLVRQPYGEGDEIGFLKGTKEDKIRDFFNPISDNLDGGMFIMDELIRKGQLEADVPFYMKGRSLSSTMILVDEAEDLTLKQIKLLGSRVSNKSNVVFIGDWKQATGKYEWNCGLVQFLKHIESNPNPLVGVMVMDEDVRSNASKYFADIV